MYCDKCTQPPKHHHGGHLPPNVLQIVEKEGPILFHQTTFPASIGDETTNPPETLDYKNVLLTYEASGWSYLYSSDGVPTLISMGGIKAVQAIKEELEALGHTVAEHYGEFNALKHEVGELEEYAHTEVANLRDITGNLQRNLEQEAADRKIADSALTTKIDAEASERAAKDDDLQSQIDTIENSSDVVDIVDTYAQLEQYDTSTLGDKDVVKVLQDETHDNAITYYRWDKPASKWDYVGEIGPYYTKAETDEKITELIPERANHIPQWVAGNMTYSALAPVIRYSAGADGVTTSIQGVLTETGQSQTMSNPQMMIPAATQSAAGVMTAADKAKLDLFPDEGLGLLDTYTTTDIDGKTYDAAYINDRLNKGNVYIGNYATTNGQSGIAIGFRATTQNSFDPVAIGRETTCKQDDSVALGAFSVTTRKGEVSIGNGGENQYYGTRYLANVRAGEKNTDAVNKKQMEDYVAEHAGGGGGVNLLDEYTTEDIDGKAYSAAYTNTRLDNNSVAIGEDANVWRSGSGSTIVESSIAIGHKASAVQNDQAGKIQGNIAIGYEAHSFSHGNNTAYNGGSIAIGNNATAANKGSISIGSSSTTNTSMDNIAIGRNSISTQNNSVAIGTGARATTRAEEVSFGSQTFFASEYPITRFLANVRDGELDQDAVTVHQLNEAVGNVNTLLETLISGEGAK